MDGSKTKKRVNEAHRRRKEIWKTKVEGGWWQQREDNAELAEQKTSLAGAISCPHKNKATRTESRSSEVATVVF